MEGSTALDRLTHHVPANPKIPWLQLSWRGCWLRTKLNITHLTHPLLCFALAWAVIFLAPNRGGIFQHYVTVSVL